MDDPPNEIASTEKMNAPLRSRVSWIQSSDEPQLSRQQSIFGTFASQVGDPSGMRGGREKRLGSGARRKSLATVAFEQAVENNAYRLRNEDELDVLKKDNEELQNFLHRRQSWKDNCGLSISNFANRMQEAMVTRKAASKFLRRSLGRKMGPTEAGTTKFQNLPSLGDSAILDYASKKQNKTPTQPVSVDIFGSHVIQAVLPSSMPPRNANKKLDRHNIISRYRPGAPDNEEELHRASRNSGIMSLKMRDRPRTAPARSKRSSPSQTMDIPTSYYQRGCDPVTIVTGTIDYTAMLDDQAAHQRVVSLKDLEYQQLIDTYDKIQESIQRKFSALLKVDNRTFLNLGIDLSSQPGDDT